MRVFVRECARGVVSLFVYGATHWKQWDVDWVRKACYSSDTQQYLVVCSQTITICFDFSFSPILSQYSLLFPPCCLHTVIPGRFSCLISSLCVDASVSHRFAWTCYSSPSLSMCFPSSFPVAQVKEQGASSFIVTG